MPKGSGFSVQGSGIVERNSFRSPPEGDRKRKEFGSTPKRNEFRSTRRAVTLLEVLWAIMVASVGMLGAIAVFPVALSQARKGQVADMTSVGADAAVHSFDAQYMRRPFRWLYFFDDPSNSTDGPVFLTAGSYGPSNQRAFTYPSNAPLYPPGNPNFYPPGTPFGPAFCLDPRFFEQNRIAWPQNGSLWSYFPAVPDGTAFNSNTAGANATTWGRLLRITLHNGNPGTATSATPMSLIQADQVFHISDQLMYERPADNSLAALQLFNQMTINGTNVPGRRQEEGRMSWMATLVPKLDQPYLTTSDLGSFLNKGPTASTHVNFFVTNSYKLSVVVFYDRPGDLIVPDATTSPPNRPYTEWTAKILPGTQADPSGGFFSDGIGGGEVRIFSCANNQYSVFNNADALDLKRNTWVALSRTVPVGNRTGIQFGPTDPLTGTVPVAPDYLYVQYLQWYRISDGDETQLDNATGRYFRDVSLIGPDWPADLLNNTTFEPERDGLADECDVFIVPGVSHVVERTIGLDREQIVQ